MAQKNQYRFVPEVQHSLVKMTVSSSCPSWQPCLCATLPSCHNTFKHQFWWGVCVWGQSRHRRMKRPGGDEHVCVRAGAIAVALRLSGYRSPQWAALQPWIWSLQRLTSVGCHFREIDDRPGKGGRMGGMDEEEEKRDAMGKREELEGPCPFKATGHG